MKSESFCQKSNSNSPVLIFCKFRSVVPRWVQTTWKGKRPIQVDRKYSLNVMSVSCNGEEENNKFFTQIACFSCLFPTLLFYPSSSSCSLLPFLSSFPLLHLWMPFSLFYTPEKTFCKPTSPSCSPPFPLRLLGTYSKKGILQAKGNRSQTSKHWDHLVFFRLK